MIQDQHARAPSPPYLTLLSPKPVDPCVGNRAICEFHGQFVFLPHHGLGLPMKCMCATTHLECISLCFFEYDMFDQPQISGKYIGNKDWN